LAALLPLFPFSRRRKNEERVKRRDTSYSSLSFFIEVPTSDSSRPHLFEVKNRCGSRGFFFSFLLPPPPSFSYGLGGSGGMRTRIVRPAFPPSLPLSSPSPFFFPPFFFLQGQRIASREGYLSPKLWLLREISIATDDAALNSPPFPPPLFFFLLPFFPLFFPDRPAEAVRRIVAIFLFVEGSSRG